MRYSFLALISFACIQSACASDHAGSGEASPPAAGNWQGMDLHLRVENQAISQLKVVATWTCSGDNGCKGSLAPTAVAGTFVVTTVQQPFEWQAATDQGVLKLSGAFKSATTVAGTYTAQLGACCAATGAWSADWVVGSAPTTGATAATAPTWGKGSSGSWHPAQPRVAVAPSLPANASADQKTMGTLVETLRAQLGVPHAVQHEALNQAAQSHADFYVAHKAQYDKKALSPHDQDATFGADFTGKNASDRAKAAGFSNPAIVEIMAFSGSPAAALQGWLDTVYHRLPLLHPQLDQWGYGQAKGGKAATEVIDATQAGPIAADLVVYPYPNQTAVPSAWSGNEGPQPPKPPLGYPSGPVISARFAGTIQVKTHELMDTQNKAVEHVWLTAANDKNLAAFDNKTVVLYAHKPLATGVYTVRLQVVRATKDEVVQWSFRVGN